MSNTTRSTSIKQSHVLDTLLKTYPNLLRKGWRAQVRSMLLPTADSDGDAEDFAELLTDFDLEPDAVAVEPELRELLFFEVEVHNLMSDRKLKLYGKFAIDLAAYEIKFGLATVNKHGHINEIDVLPHYAAWLKEGT